MVKKRSGALQRSPFSPNSTQGKEPSSLCESYESVLAR